MINQMISFHPENCPSPTSRIHPPVTNKCAIFPPVPVNLPIYTVEHSASRLMFHALISAFLPASS